MHQRTFERLAAEARELENMADDLRSIPMKTLRSLAKVAGVKLTDCFTGID